MKTKDAAVRYGFLSYATMDRAAAVADSGDTELIDAMNRELITINAARRLLDVAKEERAKQIEAARLKAEKKNHRQISARGKPKPQLLMELLGSTYTYWSGSDKNLPINSHTIPSDPDKLAEVVRLCKMVRSAVTRVLDSIEREIEKCSAKTVAKKTC